MAVCDARRRADEVLHAQTDHLNEIRHRILAGIGLPVRIRNKAHRRIKSEVERHARFSGGIRRQRRLPELHHKQNYKSDEIEKQCG